MSAMTLYELAIARAKQAEADVARLREALGEALEWISGVGAGTNEFEAYEDQRVEHARAVLEETKT
jgi:hypothetical protein